jgi:hypothetical protein
LHVAPQLHELVARREMTGLALHIGRRYAVRIEADVP